MRPRKREAVWNKDPLARATRLCFVLMPFGNEFDYNYEHIIRPAVEGIGLSPLRVDGRPLSIHIMEDVWKEIRASTVVIADLTGRNSNVLYELGLTHALAKPAILIAPSAEDLPFDIHGIRTIIYNRNRGTWGVELQEQLKRALTETINAPGEAVPSPFRDCSDSQELRLVRSTKELIDECAETIVSAKQVLVVSGSRARDPRIFEAIERQLTTFPELVHYRVVFDRPHSDALKRHLLRLLEIRDPHDRSLGYQTLHLGLFKNFALDHEWNIVANESRALILLPSFTAIARNDTALMLAAPTDANRIVQYVRDLYLKSSCLETREQVRSLRILS